MTRLFLFDLLATLTRALLADGCGKAFRMILDYFMPGMPPLAALAVGLVLGVILVEVAAMLWRRRMGSN